MGSTLGFVQECNISSGKCCRDLVPYFLIRNVLIVKLATSKNTDGSNDSRFFQPLQGLPLQAIYVTISALTDILL